MSDTDLQQVGSHPSMVGGGGGGVDNGNNLVRYMISEERCSGGGGGFTKYLCVEEQEEVRVEGVTWIHLFLREFLMRMHCR